MEDRSMICSGDTKTTCVSRKNMLDQKKDVKHFHKESNASPVSSKNNDISQIAKKLLTIYKRDIFHDSNSTNSNTQESQSKSILTVPYRIPKLEKKKSPIANSSTEANKKSPKTEKKKDNTAKSSPRRISAKNIKTGICRDSMKSKTVSTDGTKCLNPKKRGSSSIIQCDNSPKTKRKMKSPPTRNFQSPTKVSSNKRSETKQKLRSPLKNESIKHRKPSHRKEKFSPVKKQPFGVTKSALFYVERSIPVTKVPSVKQKFEQYPPLQIVKKDDSIDLRKTEIAESIPHDVEMTDLTDMESCKDLDIYSEEAMQIDFTFITAQSCFLVVDTNVLISDLNFIKQLNDISLYDCGPPFFYFPWIVVQELDGLKSNTKTKTQAIRAVQYVFSMLSKKHPKFLGQAHKMYLRSRSSNAECNDDKILACCEDLCELRPNDKIVLLTNDKNLCNKGILSGLEVKTVDALKIDIGQLSGTKERCVVLKHNPNGNEKTLNGASYIDSNNSELTVLNGIVDVRSISDNHLTCYLSRINDNIEVPRTMTICTKEDADIVIAVFNHIWQLMNNLCGLMLDTKGVEHNLMYEKIKYVPSNSEILNLLVELMPSMYTIKQRLSRIVHNCDKVETEIKFLHADLLNFVPSLPINACPPPVENFTISRLTAFCCDSANRQTLLIGLSQIQTLYTLLNESQLLKKCAVL